MKESRAVSLTQLKKGHVYYVTIQAVKVWAGRAYVSAIQTTSIVLPKLATSEIIALEVTEQPNFSTVRNKEKIREMRRAGLHDVVAK